MAQECEPVEVAVTFKVELKSGLVISEDLNKKVHKSAQKPYPVCETLRC